MFGPLNVMYIMWDNIDDTLLQSLVQTSKYKLIDDI